MTVDPPTPNSRPEGVTEKPSVPVSIEDQSQGKDVEASEEGEAVAQPLTPPTATGTKDETEYPTGAKLFLIVFSLYLAVFLNALVCKSHIRWLFQYLKHPAQMLIDAASYRTEPSSPTPSPLLPMNSIPSTTLAGTAAPSSSRDALSCYCSGKYTLSTLLNGSF